MQNIADNISKSIEKGMSQIQPAVIPIGGGQQAPQTVPPLDAGKAPSYAMGRIYNQRAKFYALYGG